MRGAQGRARIGAPRLREAAPRLLVFLEELGVGTALAILVDATLVRVVLRPVAMRPDGRADWWAPGPLRRLHARFGLREAPAAVPDGRLLHRERV
ncbi:hypothetical protein ACWDZ4_22500 [Streptomyces sp. NPDC003016]